MQGTEGLQQLERECAEGRTAPRVSLDDIRANIAFTTFLTGIEAVEVAKLHEGQFNADASRSLRTLTICLMVLKNGFSIIGTGLSPPENFDAELGKKLAYDDAVKQVWPLMGYELRQRLFLDQQDDASFGRAIGGTDGAEPFSGDDYQQDEQR